VPQGATGLTGWGGPSERSTEKENLGTQDQEVQDAQRQSRCLGSFKN
jgi:hypothetical protein